MIYLNLFQRESTGRNLRNLLMSVLVAIPLCVFGINKNDITMVSYEQSWQDANGTLALKNNSGVDIHNVSFIITYYDINGNEMDYKEFTKDVEIAIGRTRKIDIPAYEKDRHYHYYKSEGINEQKAFKIAFDLKGYHTGKTENPEKSQERNKVYNVVSQMPSFPGGQGALFEWISKNVVYPADAKEGGVQGRVIVSFVVECDGAISNVRVVKSVFPSLDKEAIRVVGSMPKWIPGRQGEEAVPVEFVVPVTFRL